MARKLVSFDWAVKRLLRSKVNFAVLEGFLSELLKDNIEIQDVLESESNKDTREQHQTRVDLLVKNRDGALIIIEVQADRQDDYLATEGCDSFGGVGVYFDGTYCKGKKNEKQQSFDFIRSGIFINNAQLNAFKKLVGKTYNLKVIAGFRGEDSSFRRIYGTSYYQIRLDLNHRLLSLNK